MRRLTFTVLFAFAFASAVFAGGPSANKDASVTPVAHATDAETMRIEGEKRFHANCGRCHAAPQKFPPRIMATVLRHMRVRALVTAEDQRYILFYMTQ
ncbi:MAG TPA: hypothetical protein VGS78_16540 [Candidatus Sulfotelmatobacter sp.]|nr:hypothetical protein [Candidatus Sulfotelmatobacter sp.]